MKELLAILLVMVLVLLISVVVGFFVSSASGQTMPLPWIEINKGTEEELANFRDGAAVWSMTTDTLIVTTTPARAATLYGKLKPPSGMRIIGGFKTKGLPANFVDPIKWAEFASTGQIVVKSTGTHVVLLENETSLSLFHKGESPIDLEGLASALEPLAATGIEWWWALPAVLETTPAAPNRTSDTIALVRAIAKSVPRSRFIGGAYRGYRDWARDAVRVANRAAMVAEVGEVRMMDVIYVNPDGVSTIKGGYTSTGAVGMSVYLRNDTAIIYPGAANWFSVGREFAVIRGRHHGR